MVNEITALVGVGSAIFGGLVTWLGLGKRIEADERLATKKFDFDKELAQRKFDLDRSQLVHKRRFELAEALLADAYRFRDVMAFVRNGATFGTEGETRESDEYELENVKRRRNTYFIPIERLQKENEFISGLMAREHTARAHFGADAATAFQLFLQTIWRVRSAALTLIEMTGDAGDPEHKKKLRKDIWAPAAHFQNGDDEVAKEIEKAVALIEGFSRPVLEWTGA